MKSKWIEYKNKKILFVDYSGFESDEIGFKDEVSSVTKVLVAEPLNSVVILADVRNTTGSKSSLDCLKESTAKVKDHVRKTAVIGIGGTKKLLMIAIAHFTGAKFMPFDDFEKAKEWLIE